MIKQFFRCSLAGSAALLVLFLAGCQKAQELRSDFSMGERVPVGQLTYSVIESTWRTQLGESFNIRTPENRFLLLKLSVTNGTGKDVSIPLLTLEANNGQTFREISDGQSVNNWFGLLRTISPGQTQQGNILFDVPLTSFKLRVPDINETGFEGYASVKIPLRLDSELPIQAPINPDDLK